MQSVNQLANIGAYGPPNLFNNSLEPVGVVVVTRISIFGYSEISLLKGA